MWVIATAATQQEVETIPYCGRAVWQDIELIRRGKLTQSCFMTKPHVRKVLKYSSNLVHALAEKLNSVSVTTGSESPRDDGVDDSFLVVNVPQEDVSREKKEYIERIVNRLEQLSLNSIQTIIQIIENVNWV